MGVYGAFRFADVALKDIGELLIFVSILCGAAERTNHEPASAKPSCAGLFLTTAGGADAGIGHRHRGRVAG